MNPIAQLKTAYHWTNADIAALFDVSISTVTNWCHRQAPSRLHGEVVNLLISLDARAVERGCREDVRRAVNMVARRGLLPLVHHAYLELERMGCADAPRA